jgi:DNA-binding MurR/RpiR family transcriptional regulator
VNLFSKQALSEFSDLDYVVYNFILKNGEKIAYMTIREVANEAHVSTTTITRFCKKLSCDGFSEFKMKYKLEAEKNKNHQKKYDSSIVLDFLERANTEAFQKQLDEIAVVIASKKHVIFLGVGNSGIIADYASRYFSNVGIFSTGVNNPMFPINLEVPGETIIITLSVEGEIDTLVQNADILKRSKATVVSITNSKNSTLAKVSDYNISYYIQRELAYESIWTKVDITSQIPAVYIIEALAKLTIQKKQSIKMSSE